MRALLVLATIAASAVASAAKSEFPELTYYDDWSVFSDGHMCWISSFSIEPDRGENSPRIFLTFDGFDPGGQLSVFDTAQYLGAELIALVVDGKAYQLDKDPADPEYAFDNTEGLKREIQQSAANTIEVVFEDKSVDRRTYFFSLEGFNSAAQRAREDCHKTT